MKNPINPESRQERLKILCVNAKEEDTRFLTKDLPVELIHTDHLDKASTELQGQKIDGIFVDVASVSPRELSSLQKESLNSKSLPWFSLAGVGELPQAIEHVHRGARGFLVKGVSNAATVLNLFQYAQKQSAD